MRNNEFTQIVKWPGYRVCQWAIDEKRRELKLWVRSKKWESKVPVFRVWPEVQTS